MSSRMGATAGPGERRHGVPGGRSSWLAACLILAAIAASAWAAAGFTARDGHSAKPASCPPRVLWHVPENDWTAARRELAPKGASALRLCRYSGLNDAAPLRLERSRLVTDQRLLTHLIDEFDALPPYPRGVAFACPSDDGSQLLALLDYPHGQRVTVAVDETGCQVVTNGDVGRLADGYGNTRVGPRLLAELNKLTAPAVADAHVMGVIRLCGGPFAQGRASTRCSSQDGTVTVVDSQGRVAATARTSHARFSLSLPPGTCTLIAETGGTRGQRTVVLTANRTVQANIVIPVR